LEFLINFDERESGDTTSRHQKELRYQIIQPNEQFLDAEKRFLRESLCMSTVFVSHEMNSFSKVVYCSFFLNSTGNEEAGKCFKINFIQLLFRCKNTVSAIRSTGEMFL
jgi:hypothetical protein